MDQSFFKGEIMRNARRLVKAKGDSALGYAENMAEKMQETGGGDDQEFWQKIAAQVELLIYEPPE